MQFNEPTPIQKQAIPAALEGKDILGTAQTGTGKTGAFSVPLLTKLHSQPGKNALVLAPTRELAAQIFKVLRQMSKGMDIYGSLVVGGESFYRQRSEIQRGVDFIVATPGRLNDHLEQGTIGLSEVTMLVLDEVDRMLDMGFAPQIAAILKHVPAQRQTLLFSATLPSETKSFAEKMVKDPVRITIGSTIDPSAGVTEEIVNTTHAEKVNTLLKVLEEREGRVLVFVRTQSQTERLARLLFADGAKVVILHGGRTQGQRKHALECFRRGTHRVLVATDLAARGIDVADIECVVNYDLPMNREDYIHRIGRTGRFGKTGVALNFLVPGDRDGIQVVTGKRPNGPEKREFRRKFQSPAFSPRGPKNGGRFSSKPKPRGRWRSENA